MEVDNRDKIILDLCGGTGSWSKPYKEAGYDVRVITFPQDVRLIKFREIPRHPVGILAAPPCTHFAGSGARWWEQKGNTALIEGLSVVDACLRIISFANPRWWALENPIGRLKDYLGDPEMYFNPCDYGDPYTKKTALWGHFHKPFKNPVEPTLGTTPILMPEKNGKKIGWNTPEAKEIRSITPQGFAKAFYESNK